MNITNPDLLILPRQKLFVLDRKIQQYSCLREVYDAWVDWTGKNHWASGGNAAVDYAIKTDRVTRIGRGLFGYMHGLISEKHLMEDGRKIIIVDRGVTRILSDDDNGIDAASISTTHITMQEYMECFESVACANNMVIVVPEDRRESHSGQRLWDLWKSRA